MNYKWPYLLDTDKERSEKLTSIIKPYVKNTYDAIDFNCGFAPLYQYFLGTYYGFDTSTECILYLTENKSKGKWKLCEDKDYNENIKIDAFIFLGVSGGTKNYESQTEISSAIRLINKYKPKVIILETSLRVPLSRLTDILNEVPYKTIEKQEYTIGSGINNRRICYVNINK